MPLLREESEKLSNNMLERGIIEEIIDHDDLFSILPFKRVDGKAYVYNREKELSEGQFIDPVTGTVPEGAASFDEITTKLRVLAGQVRVDSFLDTTQSDTNPQKAIQIAMKAKGLGRKFRRTVATGDTGATPQEFDGISMLSSAGQTLEAGADGAPMTLTMLDELIDAVPNGADVIVMREGTIRQYKNLLRTSAGGTDASMMQLRNFSRPMLTHNGIPIIRDTFLPGDEVQGAEAETCSVYAMRLNEVDGLHAIYGGSTAGIVVEDLGIDDEYDATKTRLKWYCGLALKSTRSLARLKGITNI